MNSLRQMGRKAASLSLVFALVLGGCATRPPSRQQAALRAQYEHWRAHAPKGFTVLLEPPFVVLGDESAYTMRMLTQQSVRRTVRLLQQDFFPREPAEPITIWLFRDFTSYRRHAQELFGEEPRSPYGYYLPQKRTMLMNIATGNGTLIHEIVHPFMNTNFPACPTWFNEGLASLFEESRERDGSLMGLVNWRLPGLKRAIREGQTLPFRELMALSAAEFYSPASGSGYNRYYGQSRYLCLYLQERGDLVRFYRQFVANAATDPTGYATLQRVLGVSDMDAWQRDWEKFVLTLPDPR